MIAAIMTLTLNLWLAARITATSGRLHRPWPELRNTALPPMTLAALCIAIALCFTGGLLAMRGAGARTLVQDEATCVVFGMPREAIALGAAEEVLPLERFAGRIMELGRLRV